MAQAQTQLSGSSTMGTSQGSVGRRVRAKLFDYSGSFLFLLPFLLFWLAFVLYPLIFSFITSLHRWSTLTGDQGFVGFRNYYNILLNSDSLYFNQFWPGMEHTALFVVITVPCLVVLSLLLALLLAEAPGRNIFRPIFYIPSVLSVTVACAIWRWIFQTPGLINNYLGVNINWLTTEPWAWVTIIVTTLWWTVGLNMVILLSGLLEIPKDYYEAAMIDGAGWFGRIRYITLPILRPILSFVVITQTLASFGLFGQSQLITLGGPGEETTPIVLYIFNETSANNNFAIGSAMTFLLGLVLIVLALLQLPFLRSQT